MQIKKHKKEEATQQAKQNLAQVQTQIQTCKEELKDMEARMKEREAKCKAMPQVGSVNQSAARKQSQPLSAVAVARKCAYSYIYFTVLSVTHKLLYVYK